MGDPEPACLAWPAFRLSPLSSFSWFPYNSCCFDCWANLEDTRFGADTQSEDVRQLAAGCVVAFAEVAPAVVAPDVTADLAVASSALAFPFRLAFRQT